MNLLVGPGVELAGDVARQVAGVRGVEVVVCPPYTALAAVGQALQGTVVELGAQNVHEREAGAFTGEVAAPMLVDVGCRWVIVGHSERRRGQPQENSALVNRKLRAALAAGLRAIVCVGETLEEREAGQTEAVVGAQVRESLDGCQADVGRVVLAYEPVWAIGTGRTATPGQAQAVHAFIRRLLGETWGAEAAEAMRIQYGGSVTPENAAGLLGQADVDGALVGGASLRANSFAAIVRAAAPA